MRLQNESIIAARPRPQFQHFSFSAFQLFPYETPLDNQPPASSLIRMKVLSEAANDAVEMTPAQHLALAQQAFDRFHSRCFWFMREDLAVREEDIDAIIRGLRSHGNREAFLIAAKLCR
jgi:hypothetical protein